MFLADKIDIPIRITITASHIDILMLLVTIISVFCAFKAYGHQKERSKKETACNLAREYAGSMCRLTDINQVFEASGYTKLVKSTFPMDNISEFNKSEMNKLLAKANISMNDVMDKILKPDPMLLLFYRQLKLDSSLNGNQDIMAYLEKNQETGEVSVINDSLLKRDFLNDISDLLNSLECFSMNCMYGVADEKLLYQSLHQTFLSTVWSLYPFISGVNKSNEDKYYTNLISLFELWKNRLYEITAAAEKKRNNYLRKANSVKAPIYIGKKL